MAEPSKEDLLLEAERRGILPDELKPLLDEARKRGLIKQAAPDESLGEFARGTARAAGQGLTFGFGDEAEAALRASRPKNMPQLGGIPGLVQLGVDALAGDRDGEQTYSEALEDIRGEQKTYNERHPVISTGAEIGASFAVPLGAVAKLRHAPSLARGLWESAKVGGKYGAVSGAGHSEGGIDNRIAGTLYGAGGGAALGPVVSHGVVPLATKGYRAVKDAPQIPQRIRNAFSSQPGAIVNRNLARQEDTPTKAFNQLETARETAKYSKSDPDIPITLADTGPAMKRLTRSLEAMPGRASTRAEEFLSKRQRGTPPGTPAKDVTEGMYGRVMRNLEGALKVKKKDYTREVDKLVSERAKASGPAYNRFRNMTTKDGQPVRIDVGRVLRMSEAYDKHLTPAQAALMRKARENFMAKIPLRDASRNMNNEVRLGRDAVAGEMTTTRLSTRRFDNAKRALDKMHAYAKKHDSNFEAAMLDDLRKKLIAVADLATTRPAGKWVKFKKFNAQGKQIEDRYWQPTLDPKTGKPVTESVYAKARDVYSSPSDLIDAAKLGRTFAAGDTEVTPAAYKALSTAEKRMFRIGAMQRIRKDLGDKTLGSDVARYFDTPNKMTVLREIMGPKNYQKFYASLGDEAKMLSTHRSTKNSVTAKLQSDMNDFNWVGRQMQEVRNAGGFLQYGGQLIADAITKVTRMREADAIKVAEMIFETDPAKQRAIIQYLEKTYGRPRTQRGIVAAVRRARLLNRQKLAPAPVGFASGLAQSPNSERPSGQR